MPGSSSAYRLHLGTKMVIENCVRMCVCTCVFMYAQVCVYVSVCMCACV